MSCYFSCTNLNLDQRIKTEMTEHFKIWIHSSSWYNLILCLDLNIQNIVCVAESLLYWTWFYWRFLSNKREMFYSTITACLIRRRDYLTHDNWPTWIGVGHIRLFQHFTLNFQLVIFTTEHRPTLTWGLVSQRCLKFLIRVWMQSGWVNRFPTQL